MSHKHNARQICDVSEKGHKIWGGGVIYGITIIKQINILFYFLQTVEEFFHQLDVICGAGHLEIVLKKPDKKKER